MGAVLIGLAIALAYANSFSGALVFDDEVSLTENPSIRHWWPPGDAWTPPVGGTTDGRPLANFTFAVSYALSGLQPWGHHLLNVLIHALTALLLFGVVRRTLLLLRLRDRFAADAVPLAAAVALLWAVHPLQTSTVTYLSQRTEALMALFYLLALYSFIRGVEARAAVWHPLAVAACLLGAMSKEIIATAPLVILLYDSIFIAGTLAVAWRARWRLYVALAASWVLLGVMLTGLSKRGVGFGQGVAWFDYALTECKAVVLYVSLTLWPHPLILDRGAGLVPSVAAAAPYAVGLVLALAATAWALRRWPAAGFLGACFFVILAPSSSVVPIIQQPIAENRAYLPSMAVIALLVMALHAGARRRVALAVCGALVLAAGVATFQRNRDYRSEADIWADTIAKVPQNSRAHYNLGVTLGRLGRPAEAIAAYETALRLAPNGQQAHNNLAVLLEKRPGREADAIGHYEAALRLKPDFAEARRNLAKLLARLPGRQADAIEQYEAALRFKPDDADGHIDLAALLATQPSRADDAIRHYEAALRLEPDHADAHYNLAVLLAARPGREADVPGHYETAVRLKPDHVEAHINLAAWLAGQPGREVEAAMHYETALRLRPDDADAHYNFGLLLSREPSRRADAQARYEAALRLKPDYVDAHNQLAALLAAQPGREVEAIRHYESALRLKPDQVVVHNNLALLLTRQPGRQADAFAHFETALQLQPNSAVLHFNFGRELAQISGRESEAARHFTAALKLDPNFAAAKAALQNLSRGAP